MLPRSLTPPILPRSPTAGPLPLPSSDVRLLLLSGPVSPAAEELKALEENLGREDAIRSCATKDIPRHDVQVPADWASAHALYPIPGSSWSIETTSLGESWIPAHQRKVEGPITPLGPGASPGERLAIASAAENLQCTLTEYLPPLDTPRDQISSDAYVTSFMDNTVKPVATEFRRRLEQEQLQEADSTKRVQVPSRDFSLPTPPWELISNESATAGGSLELHLNAMVQETKIHFVNAHWSGVKRIERELRWTLFPPRLGRLVAVESIDDDHPMEQDFMSWGNDINIDNNHMDWKPKELRILNSLRTEKELDDEIDLAFGDSQDLMSLLVKRKLQFFEEDDRGSEGPRPDGPGTGATARGLRPGPDIISCSAIFSTDMALQNFMTVRGQGAKRQKLTRSPHFSLLSKERQLSKQPPLGFVPIMQTNPSAVSSASPMLMPEIHPPGTPYSFYVSARLLTQRNLVRFIERHFPTAELIERGPVVSGVGHPSAKNQSYGRSTLSTHEKEEEEEGEEADVMLSPGTGLLCTTMQMIKQRSLPGRSSSSSSSPIKELIRRLYRRYEKLVVLVHEGVSILSSSSSGSGSGGQVCPGGGSVPLDERDCLALASIQGFACSLIDGDVQIMYVSGNDECLGRYIVELMCQYAGTLARPLELPYEETAVSIIFSFFSSISCFLPHRVLLLRPPWICLAGMALRRISRSWVMGISSDLYGNIVLYFWWDGFLIYDFWNEGSTMRIFISGNSSFVDSASMPTLHKPSFLTFNNNNPLRNIHSFHLQPPAFIPNIHLTIIIIIIIIIIILATTTTNMTML